MLGWVGSSMDSREKQPFHNVYFCQPETLDGFCVLRRWEAGYPSSFLDAWTGKAAPLRAPPQVLSHLWMQNSLQEVELLLYRALLDTELCCACLLQEPSPSALTATAECGSSQKSRKASSVWRTNRNIKFWLIWDLFLEKCHFLPPL